MPEWVRQFVIDRRASNKAAGTVRFYEQKLGHFQAFCLERAVLDVEDIDPALLRAYLLQLEETSHTPGGRHAHFRAVRAFLTWWGKETEPEGWKNPASKVSPPEVRPEPLPPAPLETIRALLKTCGRDKTGKRDKAIILTLVDTGVRASELLGINLADIDQVKGVILIRHGKGRKARTVFLGQKARRAVRSWLAERGRQPGQLFTRDDGGNLAYMGLVKIIRRRAAKAGVEAPGLHDFRRAFALAMHRAGVDLITLQRLMGHSDLSVLWRYLRQDEDDLQAAHRQASPGDKL